MAPSIQWLQAHDPAVSDRYSTFHLSYRGIRMSKRALGESGDETSRLQKLTSLTYLSSKLGRVFHRDHRDTITCEDDEDEFNCKRNIYDSIRHSHESADTSIGLAKFSQTVVPSTSISTKSYAPSKEQRWCTNCSKCFQRGLSRYDQYCGLDCKTAHRMRQTA